MNNITTQPKNISVQYIGELDKYTGECFFTSARIFLYKKERSNLCLHAWITTHCYAITRLEQVQCSSALPVADITRLHHNILFLAYLLNNFCNDQMVALYQFLKFISSNLTTQILCKYWESFLQFYYIILIFPIYWDLPVYGNKCDICRKNACRMCLLQVATSLLHTWKRKFVSCVCVCLSVYIVWLCEKNNNILIFVQFSLQAIYGGRWKIP